MARNNSNRATNMNTAPVIPSAPPKPVEDLPKATAVIEETIVPVITRTGHTVSELRDLLVDATCALAEKMADDNFTGLPANTIECYETARRIYQTLKEDK